MPDLIAEHAECERVRHLVAHEVAAIERAFAERLVTELRKLKPSTDHPADRAFAKGVDVAATTVRVLAGLPADLKEADHG
jgi:hypothetical protein